MSETESHKDLLRAVLERAVLDYFGVSVGNERGRWGNQATQWFFIRDETDGLSFLQICEDLDLDPDLILKFLKNTSKKAFKEKYRKSFKIENTALTDDISTLHLILNE